MQESARVALSWVRANAARYGVDPAFHRGADIHVHVQSGDVRKEGASAGVTMVAALVSALTGRVGHGDLAMTGEITLSSRVLPVGGIKEKVVETHDRIVGRTYREVARTCEGQLGDETAAVREALRAFAELGTALLGARDTGEALNAVIADRPGWEGLGDLVARAAALTNTVASDPLNHVLGGYSRFRRYTPRMLRTLDIEASPVAKPLLEAVDVLRSDATARPTVFLRPNSKWSRQYSQKEYSQKEYSRVNELPSVALTTRFLALCEQHGSQRLAVRLVAVGRGTGVSRLPASDDWTEWDADEMRAAVDHLERLRIR